MTIVFLSVTETIVTNLTANDTFFEVSNTSDQHNLFSVGCIHSLDWTTGLEYWTGLLFSFYEQVSVFIFRKKPTRSYTFLQSTSTWLL